MERSNPTGTYSDSVSDRLPPSKAAGLFGPRGAERERVIAAALLVVLLGLAAWLRLSFIDTILFINDEAQWSYEALRLVRGEYFPLTGIPSLVWVATGPFFIYLIALPMLISTDPSFVTGFIGLLNVVGVGLTFVFGRRYFGLTAGATAAFLYAVNPWAVHFSRHIWNPNVMPLFSLILVWSLFLAVVERRRGFLVVAGAAAAILLQLNQAGLALVLLLGIVLVLFWRETGLRGLALTVIGAVLVSLPYLYHMVSTGFADLFQAVSVGTGAAAVDAEALRHMVGFAAGWGYPSEQFGIWTKPGESVPDGTAFDILETALFATSVVLLMFAVVRRNGLGQISRRQAFILLAWLLIPVLVMTRHSFEIHRRYLLLTQPAQFIAIGIAVALAVRWLRQRLRERGVAGRLAIFSPLLLVIGIGTGQAWLDYTVLDMIERNGIEVSYGIPIRYHREAFARISRLVGAGYGEPVYIWSSERMVRTARYMGEVNGIEVRNLTERNQLVLGTEDGRDKLYVFITADPADEEMPRRLGFERLDEETVTVAGGQVHFVFYRQPAGTRARVEATLANAGPDLRLSNGLRLRAWSGDSVPAEGTPLLLGWEGWRDLDVSGPDPTYCLAQHFVDAAGQDLAVRDIIVERMTRLRPEDLLLTLTAVPVLPEAERQMAWLDLGMYHCWQRDSAQVLDAAGQPTDAPLRIGPFRVGETAPAAAPEHPLDLRLGDSIRLLGYDLSGEALPGGSLEVTLHWQALAPVGADYTVFVQLLDNGQVVAQQDNPPRAGRYPTSLWEAGEVVTDMYTLVVPAKGAPSYQLIAGMYTPADLQRLPVFAADGQPLGDAVELGMIQ